MCNVGVCNGFLEREKKWSNRRKILEAQERSTTRTLTWKTHTRLGLTFQWWEAKCKYLVTQILRNVSISQYLNHCFPAIVHKFQRFLFRNSEDWMNDPNIVTIYYSLGLQNTIKNIYPALSWMTNIVYFPTTTASNAMYMPYSACRK